MIKLAHLLNEMAMKPTLEREFEKIVRSLQVDYEEYVKTTIRSTIKKAEPIVDAANKEAVSKNNTSLIFGKTFGSYGPLNPRVNGFGTFLRQWIFLPKEYAATKDTRFKKDIDKAYDELKKADTTGNDNVEDLRRAWKMEMAQYVTMPESYWKDALDKEAKHASEMFYTSFINKNVEKFSNVIKGKDITDIKHNLTPRSLSGNIIVECSDGSRFRASFNVETSISKNGKWFNRFPTRFHDVTFADGTKMKSPSEAKMKSPFEAKMKKEF